MPSGIPKNGVNKGWFKLGYKHSEETKKKIGLNGFHYGMLGKKHTQEWKINQSKIMSGRKHTEETKEKMRKNHRGTLEIHFSKEHKQKLSESHKGEKCHFWKGGITLNRKEYAKKYNKNRYLTEEQKKHISWRKNKRNRVIKRLRIESKTHTFKEWENLKKQYKFTCPCCKKPEPEIKLTEDHIIPLSKEGSDLIENIQPLCSLCNYKKHTKIIKY